MRRSSILFRHALIEGGSLKYDKIIQGGLQNAEYFPDCEV